jgi:hypothetical protein
MPIPAASDGRGAMKPGSLLSLGGSIAWGRHRPNQGDFPPGWFNHVSPAMAAAGSPREAPRAVGGDARMPIPAPVVEPWSHEHHHPRPITPTRTLERSQRRASGVGLMASREWYGRREASEVPGLDCLQPGHMTVAFEQPGAWPTEGDAVPRASWCLWCGTGVSNELLPD